MRAIFSLITSLILCSGWAQRPPQQWVFGQGLGMDFSGGGAPRFFTIPWQPSSPGEQDDANLCSVYADSSGKVQLYFLNGAYYDANHNLIWRDSSFVYQRPRGVTPGLYNVRSTGNNFSWFYPKHKTSQRLEPIHIYAREIYMGNYVWNNRYKVTQIVKDSSGWRVQILDQAPDNLNNQNLYELQYARGGYNFYSETPFIFSRNGRSGPLINIFYLDNQKLDSSSFGYTASNGYHPMWLNDFAYLSIPHPLSKTRLVLRPRMTQNIRDSRCYLQEYLLLPNFQFFSLGRKWPLMVPPIQANGDHMAWFPSAIEISPQGRYLFALMYSFADYMGPYPKLMRYDLFAEDSTDFVNSAAEIPLPAVYQGNSTTRKTIIDMKSAPDGNIYFIAHRNFRAYYSNYPHHRQMGRITHPDTSDPFRIGFNDNYHTFPPYTLHNFFPNRIPGELAMAPFKQLSYCPGGVRLHFNYPRVTDSLWWSFGAPSLGAANHDTATHPVIPYTQPGKYEVSVELWWKGRQLRTLRDTVLVKPEPELNLPQDTTLCPGDTLFLDGRQGFDAQYRWNTGSRDSTLIVRDSGYYQLTISTTCDTVSDSLQVRYLDLPQPRPQADTVLCRGDSLLWDLSQPGDVTYQWRDGLTAPQRWIDSAGLYQVRLSTGCDTIQETARVSFESCDCRYHLPDAFSPNGDGVNERFTIKYACEEVAFELQILNRWGQVIYRQNENMPGWDGTFQGQRAPEGVYLYRLVFRGGQGDHFLEDEAHGSLVLMR